MRSAVAKYTCICGNTQVVEAEYEQPENWASGSVAEVPVISAQITGKAIYELCPGCRVSIADTIALLDGSVPIIP